LIPAHIKKISHNLLQNQQNNSSCPEFEKQEIPAFVSKLFITLPL